MQYNKNNIIYFVACTFNYITIGCNLEIIYPSTSIEFLIVINICCDVMRIDMCNRMWHNGDAIDQFSAGVAVVGMFNGIMVKIVSLIKISKLLLLLNTLTTIFNTNQSYLNKSSVFEYKYYNNSHTTIIMKASCKISGTSLILGLFLGAIYFIIQAMDTIRAIVSHELIEFGIIMIIMIHLAIILAVQSPISAVDVDPQTICNVCDVFYYSFLFYFWFLNL